MIKNKKYKYNITFYKGCSDNLTNKLIDYKISYKTEDISKAIDTDYGDMNVINTTDRNYNPDEEKTKLRQKEIIEKEKVRLQKSIDESMSEQDKDKLFEENKQLMETIKKVEYGEIKQWMLDHGEEEDEITEESIKKNRDSYFDYLYNDDYTYRVYNKDGTYDLARDDHQEELDREEERNLEKGKKSTITSGESNAIECDYGIIFKLTEYVPISGENYLNLIKYLKSF